MTSVRWDIKIFQLFVHVWVCLDMMPDSVAGLLIPSQISAAASCRGQGMVKSEECRNSNCPPIPIECGDGRKKVTALDGKSHQSQDSGGDEVVFSVDKFSKPSAPQKKNSQRKKKKGQRNMTNQSSQKKKINIKRNGDIPDIHWYVSAILLP